MKKLLLSVAFAATCFFGVQAQIVVQNVTIPSIGGGTVVPLLQGAQGNYQVEGNLIPKVTGTFNSVEIEATLTASVGETFANDLTIIVTSNSNVQTADILLQVGGFSNFTQNKFPWPCGDECDSDEVGTPLFGLVEFAGLDFANTEYVIWFANGYINANPPTNSGAWSVAEVVFGGLSVSQGGSSSIESNAVISAVAFPNPASDLLTVSVEGEEVVAVSVVSMDGKVVSTVEGSVAQVAELTAGMYLYEATTASGLVVRNAFIKK